MSKDTFTDKFDLDKISLELWLSLLDAHFLYMGITNSQEDLDKKKHFLLVSLGSEVYSALGRLCAPELPHTVI